jgi:hypothetical protein
MTRRAHGSPTPRSPRWNTRRSPRGKARRRLASSRVRSTSRSSAEGPIFMTSLRPQFYPVDELPGAYLGYGEHRLALAAQLFANGDGSIARSYVTGMPCRSSAARNFSGFLVGAIQTGDSTDSRFVRDIPSGLLTSSPI